MAQKKTTTNNILLDISSQYSVLRHLSYQDYIEGLYQLMVEKTGKYSYRNYAVDLGFPDSNLVWLISTGRRKLTAKTSQRIAKALKLAGTETKYLKTLMEFNNATKSDSRETLFKILVSLKGTGISDADQKTIFEYYSEWHHPVIREMDALNDFRYDPEWIADRLMIKIRPLHIKKSLELLERLDFIKHDPITNTISRSSKQIFPEQSTEAMAMTRFHQKMCEVARDSIPNIKSNDRDFNALTISVSEKNVTKIQELAHEFCRKVMELDKNETNRDEVYQVNVQLFPVTQAIVTTEEGKDKKK